MLIQFSFKNVLSFKDKYTLDMTAVNAYKEHMYNLIDIGIKEKFLKVASIYGANASGKSNLFIAFSVFKSIVNKSFNNEETELTDESTTIISDLYFPFSFDNDKNNSEFEIVEIYNNSEYRYGFEYNDSNIVSEWFYKKDLKTNRTITIFERDNQVFEFGASVRKECEQYSDKIKKETLAVSFFNKLSLTNSVFSDLYNQIMSIRPLTPGLCEDNSILSRLLPTTIERQKSKLLDFLEAIDSGIKDIQYKEDKKVFITFHEDVNGKLHPLSLFDESDGTLKSINLFIFIMSAVKNNYSIFIDELNVKLHPLVMKFIIDLFYESDSQAQLIYTSHDTTLLDKKFFRRDQIWFVQKDKYGHSELVSLSDFKVRSDASFEKDYLAGVYGGIPFINKGFSMKDGE